MAVDDWIETGARAQAVTALLEEQGGVVEGVAAINIESNPQRDGTVSIEFKILRPEDQGLLANVADGVFDREIDARLTQEFLNDARHHLAVALENGVMVGMASAVHYIHPDKHPELWINEVGVAPAHQGQGVGKALLSALLEVGSALGCTEAWVLTDRPNISAMRLYSSLGGTESPSDQVMFTFRLTAERTGPPEP